MGLNFSFPAASSSLSYELLFYLRSPFNAVLSSDIPCLELRKVCAIDMGNKEKEGRNVCADEITNG
jgi:hypothetical protein